jgi:hypothetical protein
MLRRPNLAQPDRYALEIDETTLMFMEDAIADKIKHLEDDVASHHLCNKKSEIGCELRDKKSGCDEDMMFLYESLGKLYKLLYSARFLRTNTDHKEA